MLVSSIMRLFYLLRFRFNCLYFLWFLFIKQKQHFFSLYTCKYHIYACLYYVYHICDCKPRCLTDIAVSFSIPPECKIIAYKQSVIIFMTYPWHQLVICASVLSLTTNPSIISWFLVLHTYSCQKYSNCHLILKFKTYLHYSRAAR